MPSLLFLVAIAVAALADAFALDVALLVLLLVVLLMVVVDVGVVVACAASRFLADTVESVFLKIALNVATAVVGVIELLSLLLRRLLLPPWRLLLQD